MILLLYYRANNFFKILSRKPRYNIMQLFADSSNVKLSQVLPERSFKLKFPALRVSARHSVSHKPFR